MNGRERRNKLIQILSESSTPLSGKELSKRLDVSRQVIVQDMALLRAQDHEILSTNQGYLLTGGKKISRVFKVIHSDKEVEEELGLIVDYGGHVKMYLYIIRSMELSGQIFILPAETTSGNFFRTCRTDILPC